MFVSKVCEKYFILYIKNWRHQRFAKRYSVSEARPETWSGEDVLFLTRSSFPSFGFYVLYQIREQTSWNYLVFTTDDSLVILWKVTSVQGETVCTCISRFPRHVFQRRGNNFAQISLKITSLFNIILSPRAFFLGKEQEYMMISRPPADTKWYCSCTDPLHYGFAAW